MITTTTAIAARQGEMSPNHFIARIVLVSTTVSFIAMAILAQVV